VTYNSDGTYTLPTAQPTADGSIFGGWVLVNGPLDQASSYTALPDDNPLTKDEVGYPMWIPATVTYDNSTLPDGTASGLPLVNGTGTAPVLAGGLATAPTDAEQTVDGYQLLGWYDQNGNLWDFGSSVVDTSDVASGDTTASVTLTAKWAPIYTVTFNLNCPSGSACTSTSTDNLAPLQVANKLFVSGAGDPTDLGSVPTDSTGAYTFQCWAAGTADAAPAAGTACYGDGGTPQIAAMNTETNVYLYAMWAPTATFVPTVSFEWNPPATLSSDGKTVTFTQVVTNTGSDQIDWQPNDVWTDGAGVLTFTGCVYIPPDAGAYDILGQAYCSFSYAVDPADAGKTVSFFSSATGTGVISGLPVGYSNETTSVDIPEAPVLVVQAIAGGAVNTPGAAGVAGAVVLVGLGLVGVVYARRRAGLMF